MVQASNCFQLNVLSMDGADYKLLPTERDTWHVLSMRGRGDTLLYTWHSQGEWWRWRTASHLDVLMWMVEATNCFTLGILRVNGWGDKLLHTWFSQCEWQRRQTTSHRRSQCEWWRRQTASNWTFSACDKPLHGVNRSKKYRSAPSAIKVSASCAL